ncbi:MAG: NTP transferase domain-containing protein [Ginsengibacter sp.]
MVAVWPSFNCASSPHNLLTGANAEEVSLTLENNKELTIVYNQFWQEGMASGIVAGITKMLSLNDNFKNVIISVCDQPFVSAELFCEMISKKEETLKGIVACSYADTIGTPVLFGQKYFKRLQDLKGSEGAKSLIKTNKDDLATVFFPRGNIDIDTEEDYKNLLSLQKI